MELNNKLAQEAKALLLEGGHGKFAGLKDILSISELETEKPIVLIRRIRTRLAVDQGQINYFSFYSWLKAWRKTNRRGSSMVSADPPKTQTSFQFTDPSTLPQRQEPLIKIV